MRFPTATVRRAPLAPCLALAMAVALMPGCSDIPIAGPDLPGEALSAGNATTAAMSKASAATHSVSDVLTFADMTPVGSSRLTRTDAGVSYQVRTTELEPGTATTVWMVIFNHPEHCATSPCQIDDLFNADVMADVAYAAGHVIGNAGRGGFAGRRNVGDNSGSIMGEWFGLPEHGLLDARGAEIHFIVRNHGPIIPGLVNEMISTFNAGCGPDAMEGAPPVPETLGTHGPNTCEDVQFAMHLP